MRCRPGDLAVISSADGFGFARAVAEACVGRYVVVEYPRRPIGDGTPSVDGLVWHIERPFVVSVRGELVEILGVEDHCLRPIRDPGDDAVDETLLWVPSPVKEVA